MFCPIAINPVTDYLRHSPLPDLLHLGILPVGISDRHDAAQLLQYLFVGHFLLPFLGGRPRNVRARLVLVAVERRRTRRRVRVGRLHRRRVARTQAVRRRMYGHVVGVLDFFKRFRILEEIIRHPHCYYGTASELRH